MGLFSVLNGLQTYLVENTISIGNVHHVLLYKVRNEIKIYKKTMQFHEISKGHHYIVSLQKGHLKVTSKRKSTYKIFVSA